MAPCSQLRNRSLNQSQESSVACPGFEPIARERACRTMRAMHTRSVGTSPIGLRRRPSFSVRTPQGNRNELGDREQNVAETPVTATRINGLEDMLCVRDAGAADSDLFMGLESGAINSKQSVRRFEACRADKIGSSLRTSSLPSMGPLSHWCGLRDSR